MKRPKINEREVGDGPFLNLLMTSGPAWVQKVSKVVTERMNDETNFRVDATEFAKKVREYNKLQPFNFHEIIFTLFNFPIYISIYAAHLYDSVVLYAKALDKMIREKEEKNEPVDIYQLARDGKRTTA